MTTLSDSERALRTAWNRDGSLRIVHSKGLHSPKDYYFTAKLSMLITAQEAHGPCAWRVARLIRASQRSRPGSLALGDPNVPQRPVDDRLCRARYCTATSRTIEMRAPCMAAVRGMHCSSVATGPHSGPHCQWQCHGAGWRRTQSPNCRPLAIATYMLHVMYVRTHALPTRAAARCAQFPYAPSHAGVARRRPPLLDRADAPRGHRSIIDSMHHALHACTHARTHAERPPRSIETRQRR